MTEIKRCCGTCELWIPRRGPTGRIRPSLPGGCDWKMPSSAIMMKFVVRPVRYADGTDCQCWKLKARVRLSNAGRPALEEER